MSHNVTTKITELHPDRMLIRGYNLSDLIGQYAFGDVVYLLLAGELPEENQGKMIEAMLISCVDHGVNAPSVNVTRTVASCGVPLSTAVAAGISAVGENHAGAGEALGRIMHEAAAADPEQPAVEIARKIVTETRQLKRRLPGFGHRYYTEADHRAVRLLALSDELGISGKFVALVKAIELELKTQTGKQLPMNVDGAQAAILLDLGLGHDLAKAIFIIGRSAGLCAQAHEQLTTGRPVRFAARVEADYQGPEERSVPKKL
jgi:citrate synthase